MDRTKGSVDTAPAPLPSFTSMQFDKLVPQETSYHAQDASHPSPLQKATSQVDRSHHRQPSLGNKPPFGHAALLPPPVMQLHTQEDASNTSGTDLAHTMHHLDVSDAYATSATVPQADDKSLDDVFTGQMPHMVPTMTLPSQEKDVAGRTAFSRLEKEAGVDQTRWTVMPNSAATPLSSDTPPAMGQALGSPSPMAAPSVAQAYPAPPPVPDASPRIPKSPRWRRQSSAAQVDDGDESSSIAGRLSRRSLMALGSIFKVSPRRDKAKEDANPESAETDAVSTPSRMSRISFTRRRRQSTHLRTPRMDDAQGGGSDAAMLEAPPSSLPVSAPHGASKAGRRDASDTGPVPRTEPSPYYAAKAQGSRIPRASSMMRMLNRKPADTDEKPALPTSASMQSVSSVSESPSQRMLAARASLMSEQGGPSRRYAEEIGSPVKARSVRKSYASSEAMEALRRQRQLAATPKEKGAVRTRQDRASGTIPTVGAVAASRVEQAMHVSSQRDQASEALRRSRDEAESDAATQKHDTVAAESVLGTPSSGPSAGHVTSGTVASVAPAGWASVNRPYAPESGIPVPTNVRQRSSSVQSRRATRTPTLVDDTAAADEEMERHVQRVCRRKIAAGARPEDLDKLYSFPQPVAASKRLSPRQAEVIYGNHLCPYEVQEMKEYENIYYVGSFARHKHYAVPNKPERNFGYDDERGDYIVNMRDHLAYRYEITKLLGRGSFGQVLQCRDHKTGKYVAIKLIRNKRRFHHQAVVEVKIMKHLTEADTDDGHHVVHMSDSFTFRHHLCVTMELLSINLYELIKANSFEGFSTTLIRRFAYQTLTCLSLMWQAHIVHCDLKPENILLVHPRRSEIRVIDFGSSCFEDEKVYTYIQSRFYRSPEVILGVDYHMAIDMWSLGCILVELHTGYPIFPGENEQDQLACMMEVLGVPDRGLLERSTRRKLFFDSTGAPRPVVTSRGQKRRPSSKSLISAVRSNDELFLDFIARCLTWDPERRLQPEAALRHPWFLQRGAEAGALPRVPTTRRPPRSDAPRDGSLLPRATPAGASVRSSDVSTQ
ncbi:hypothetical protein MCAP1_002914 [Malassezia caprae]|uniref:dual-specificity kinase n=1 Tax=Malassezia caprae TaxID=1381934 RepID=A0AAF0J152_9BASI|nr:hypothetical protein MCAP1_002914 [Malassezia caprae]